MSSKRVFAEAKNRVFAQRVEKHLINCEMCVVEICIYSCNPKLVLLETTFKPV